jgi:4-aminobutyrate aminotransferase-like enzyme
LACAQTLKDTIRLQTAGDVAAFIAEPILGEGGIVTPPDGYFKIAVEIFHESGALFIVDEVQTGFGRTGKMFGIEHHAGVQSDIMTMAKGIAAGFPLGAFIAREPISDVMKPGDHLSTFGGNPISCAAALANIKVIQQEKLVENATQRGEQLFAQLRRMQEKHALIGDIRGKGLMIGIELVRDRRTKVPADKETKLLRALMRENGVLVGMGGLFGNVIRFQPPLSITPEECDRAVSIFDTCLSKMGSTL